MEFKMLNISLSLTNLRSSISEASSSFFKQVCHEEDEYNDPAWEIENCFLKLLSLAEAAGLNELHKMILSEYKVIKKSAQGFAEDAMGPDEPYAIHLQRIRQYMYSIDSFFPEEDQTKITKDLLQIIRDIHYTITDTKIFKQVPENEKEVHLRIEGILKCVFPDLKHKPTLTKSIKNFEPDTGIPSIQTLIEYKFISVEKDVPKIADQVLADTRAYTSKGWNRFLYVIYETHRFKSEKEWNNLLTDCGIPKNTTIVVLNGEPVKKKRFRKNIQVS